MSELCRNVKILFFMNTHTNYEKSDTLNPLPITLHIFKSMFNLSVQYLFTFVTIMSLEDSLRMAHFSFFLFLRHKKMIKKYIDLVTPWREESNFNAIFKCHLLPEYRDASLKYLSLPSLRQLVNKKATQHFTGHCSSGIV